MLKADKGYTGDMRRTGATILLLVVILWIACPAFACLASLPSHACCRTMDQHCDSHNLSASANCCQFRGAGENPTAERASTPEPLGQAEPAPLPSALLSPPQSAVVPCASGTPTGLRPPGICILRI